MTTTTAKKVFSAFQSYTNETKQDVVEKIFVFLTKNIESGQVVDKDNLENLKNTFKDELNKENNELLLNIKQKNKNKQPRPPTAYNIFIKDTMERLKKEFPDMKNTLLMSKAAEEWNKHKAKLAESGEEVKTKAKKTKAAK